MSSKLEPKGTNFLHFSCEDWGSHSPEFIKYPH